MTTEKKSETVTRSLIRDSLQSQLEVTHDEAAHLLESILSTTVAVISKGHTLKLAGFGTFLIHQKNERIGRNPKTKEEAVISTRKSVSFRPSATLRKLVNRT